MNILNGAKRVIADTANATTAAAGAISGAAVGAVVGGVRGTATGVRDGVSSGSRSTPAAAMTLAVIGAVGLMEWPVLVGVGGTALLVHHLSQRSQPHEASRR